VWQRRSVLAFLVLGRKKETHTIGVELLYGAMRDSISLNQSSFFTVAIRTTVTEAHQPVEAPPGAYGITQISDH
jgi:hypothetical protein